MSGRETTGVKPWPTLSRLCRRLLQAVQILHILGSARVADALNESHSVLVVLFECTILTDRIQSAPKSHVSASTKTGNTISLKQETSLLTLFAQWGSELAMTWCALCNQIKKQSYVRPLGILRAVRLTQQYLIVYEFVHCTAESRCHAGSILRGGSATVAHMFRRIPAKYE